MAPPSVDGEHHAVENTPNNKVQAGAVPESADKHRNQEVHVDTRDGDPRATERDIHVVHQPGGKRDMPVSPEFRDVDLEIWPIEILRYLYAKQPRGTYGNIGIGRKIRIDFDAIGQ